MLSRISPSKAALLRECAFSFRPDVELPPQPEPGAAALLGTAVHEHIAIFLDNDTWDTYPEIDDTSEAARLFYVWEKWWRQYAVEPPFVSTIIEAIETAFAYDPRTRWSRKLGDSIDRKYVQYGLNPGREIAGTPDLIRKHMREDGFTILQVHDWKTGRQENSSFDQLLFGALLFWGQMTVPEKSAIEESGQIQLSLHFIDESGVRTVNKIVTPFHLEVFATELENIVDHLLEAEPQPGTHCTELYCPARATCPATAKAMELVSNQGAHNAPESAFKMVYNSKDIESPSHALHMYEKLLVVEECVKFAWKALEGWIDTHPDGVPLSDKRHYRAIEEIREKIVYSPEAMAILKQVFRERAEEVLKIEIPKGEVSKLAKEILDGSSSKGKFLEKEIFSELRDKGCIEQKRLVMYKAVK